ncbi:MAG: Chitinase A1 precursor [Microgenomates bacterium OLB23]|nr:MAG: Chitinase A1 precursor [Microgenomates bacterium OLB23]
MLGRFSDTEEYSTRGSLRLEDAGSWSQTYTNSTPLPFTQGTSAKSDGTFIYFLYAGDTYFTRYNPASNKWSQMANAPYSASIYKSDMVYLDGYMYVLFGGYQKKFARYHIASNTWEDLTDMPDYTLYGASLSTDGTNVFLLRATNTTDFWRYNVSSDTWTTLTAAPATMYTGADLVYEGGYMYSPRGNNTTTFYRYDVSGNSWTTMTVAPATLNGDHSIVSDGTYLYVTRSGAQNTFYRYSMAGNSWTTLNTLPATVNYHSFVYVSSVDKYYMFRGLGVYDIWQYNPNTDAFTYHADLPIALGTGSDLIHLSGYLYLTRGTSTNYYRYQISSNTWSTLTSAPGNIAADQRGVAAGSLLYYFSGASTTFYSYNPASNTWSTLTAAPAAVGAGDSLMYPGSGDYIYASRGNNTSVFWRYSISGNSWDDASVADLPTGVQMYFGSRLLSDGTYIYAITGGTGKSKLYRYDISGNSWSDLGTLPFNPMYGTDGVYYDGKLYVQGGNYRRSFFEYDIAGGEWRRLENLSGYLGNDIGPYTGGALASDGAGTLYSTWGSTYARMQSYTIETDKYEDTGTWTSQIIDLSYVSAFGDLTVTDSTPGTSSVTYETRTSDDGTTWSSWQALSVSSIQSTPNRYIQVRATLTADTGNADTPVINDMTINYTGDVTAPTNPSTFTGLSQQVSGIAISSGSTYGYVHPYISWTGASDTESSIAGYYVYFGTDSDADPETEGAFITTAGYVITESLTNGSTYYLRLRTKDSADNMSSAVTGFTYVYGGVSVTSSAFNESSEYAGTATNILTLNDDIKLATDSGGIWEQERISLSPAGLSYGAGFAYISSSEKLYTFRGLNTTTFYEYDIPTDVWSTLTAAPAAVNYGWIVPGPSGYLYAARGAATASFWQYDIAAGTWSDEAAADAPLTLTSGTAAIWDGSRYIYVSRGGADDAFFRYDTQFDTWDTLANVQFDVLSTMNAGADMAYNGSDTLYAIQGNYLSGFSSYDISSDSWTLLPALPHVANNDGTISFDATQNAIYYLPGNGRVAFYKYDISSQTWSELPESPGSIGQGADIRNVDGKLYVIRGGSTQNVYTYDTVTNKWVLPTLGLFGTYFRGVDYLPFNYGADIEKGDGNYLYITKGNYDNLFIRYDASTGSVLRLSDAPNGFYQGGDLLYESDSNKIYAITTAADTGFYQYDIATDTWSELTSDPLTAAPGTGASLTYDGNRYIYYARGGNTTSFYRYDTQSSEGARWSTLTGAPAALNYGSELVYKDGYIYTPRGNNTTTFYRYDVGAGTWSSLTAVTAAIYNDGFLVDTGQTDTLIACRGVNTNACYTYSISGNSWTAIDGAPANFYIGAAGAVGSNKMYAIPGASGTNTFTDGLYSYVLETPNSSFQSSGSYESQEHDLTSVYKFANLTVNYAEAVSGTTLTPYTRSSEDGDDWSSWTAAASKKKIGTVAEYEIKSPDNRYLQVRFDLTSGDGLYTDVIDSYTVNYYTDASAPTNPTSLTAYTTATQSATMTTNTWYSHTAPNFDWPDADAVGGATDGAGGSGIDGYYVYFGTNSSADPAVDGVLQTTTAYTASSLSSGSTYYLRIKAIDDAGNVAATTWQPFIYKLDTTAPTNPTTVTSDPPGYSATNSFDFEWNAGSDANSGIAEYCYKTGAVGATETCTAATTITGIAAYQSGANTFYVRAKDTAGNFASSYVNASFYYSSTAPSAPQNVTATPSTNTVNEFAFSWDPPANYSGAQSNLRYYYSVNVLPTSTNVNQVGLSVTYLSAGAYATQSGSNTFYVVAKDEAGNIDYNVYGSVTFTANTSAPGIPTNIEMADVSDKSTEAWKLAITWNAPTSTGSGIANYKLYRSATADADCSTSMASFTLIGTTTEASYVNSSLSQQDYYYCVKACDSTGNCSAPSETATMYPDGRWESAPTLTASPSASVKTRSAIITWSTNRTSSSFVKYGKTSGTYGEEVGSSTQVTAHEVSLKELDPGAQYYYKVLWTDEDGNTSSSDEYSFTTNAAPNVADVKITDVSISTAYVTANIQYATEATLQYGPTTAYGGTSSIPVSKTGGLYSVKLEDLEQDTLYHMRIVAEDDEGNVYNGEDRTFQTLPVPKITNIKIQQVAGLPTAAVRLIWTSNTEISTIVTYYPTAKPEQAQDKINLTRSLNHELIITDLSDETDYTILVKGRDVAGNEAIADKVQLKTAADLRAPEILNLTVESTIVGIGEEAKAQIIVCWDTDEPATTQVEYNLGTSTTYGSTTQEDTNLTTNHCATVSGAQPAQIYQLRAISKDKSNNNGVSFDTVIVTPSATKDVLNLVVNKLSTTFGFLKRFTK